MGKKKQPSYRVVVADSESPRDGRFIERIGFYDPRTEPPTIEIDQERARYWLSQGAQPSDPVVRLLRKVGVLSGGPGAADVEDVKEPETKAEPSAEAEAEPEAEEVSEVEVEEEGQEETASETA
jgi:small subunit ribosomal protein S16